MLQTPVADTNPIEAHPNVQVDRLIRQVTARIPVPSGAAYFVLPNGTIVVTTEKALATRHLLPEPLPAPTPAQIKRTRDMRHAGSALPVQRL